MVDVQFVILPGLQRLIDTCVTPDGGVGQNGTPAKQTQEQVTPESGPQDTLDTDTVSEAAAAAHSDEVTAPPAGQTM